MEEEKTRHATPHMGSTPLGRWNVRAGNFAFLVSVGSCLRGELDTMNTITCLERDLRGRKPWLGIR